MSQTPDQIWTRLAAIEAKLDHLYRTLNINPPSPESLVAAGVSAEVAEIARGGNLIGAIKRHRQLTGVDLASAKKAVEATL